MVRGVADWLERLIFGPTASIYRRFVRLVLTLTVVFALANGLVVFDVIGVGQNVADALYVVGVAVFTVFIIAGLLQFVVLARAFDRGTQEVAETAEQLESAAADVAESAKEVETAANAVEDAVDEVEEAADEIEASAADPDEQTERAVEAKDRAAEAKSQTNAVKDQTEDAKATATDVEETAAKTKESLPDEPDESDR